MNIRVNRKVLFMMKSHGHRFITPDRLSPGGRIGIVAPSSAFEDAAFRSGVDVLREMGFFPVIPEALFRKKRYLAGEDAHRAHLVNGMFADDDIHAILCARGGYGAIRVLPHLDWETICGHPKIFMGFSDISVLLAALNKRCGLVTFHGPVVTSLAISDSETKASLKAALSSIVPLTYTLENPIVIRPGRGLGPVTGGNLCTLCHLAGTAFAPETAGRILFLEDCGELPYKIDRMLTHLKMCGWFDTLAGVMIGSFERCGEASTILEILTEVFEGAPFPVLGGFDIGHGARNLTLPMGIEAVLDADRGQLTFCEPATAVGCGGS